jgi:hypothetical protein
VVSSTRYHQKGLKIVNVEAFRPIKLNERTERMNDTHKFAVGDKVMINGVEGVIHALSPYTFIAPAYDVRVTKTIIIPVSERSIEKIEQQESEVKHG